MALFVGAGLRPLITQIVTQMAAERLFLSTFAVGLGLTCFGLGLQRLAPLDPWETPSFPVGWPNARVDASAIWSGTCIMGFAAARHLGVLVDLTRGKYRPGKGRVGIAFILAGVALTLPLPKPKESPRRRKLMSTLRRQYEEWCEEQAQLTAETLPTHERAERKAELMGRRAELMGLLREMDETRG